MIGAALGLATASSVRAQLPCSYTVTVLPNSPCFGGQSPAIPVAINNLGHVLLFASQCGNPFDETYVWTGGPTLTPIPRPANMLGFAGADINDNDVIVGTALMTYAGQRAFMYDLKSGVWTELPPLNPPTGWSGASAINNYNEVCGFRAIGGPDEPFYPRTAFRWTAASGFTDLGLIDGESTSGADIADDGAVAISRTGGGSAGYRWNDGQLTSMGSLDGADSIGPSAITSGGRMVGGSLFIVGINFWGVALDFNQDVLSILPVPDAEHGSCTTLDVNSSGLILGRCQAINQFGQPPGPWTPYIWQYGSPVDLNALLPPGSGLTLGSAPALTEDGRIVVEARTSRGANQVVMLTPQPRMIGDTNCDQVVDTVDLIAVILDWGQSESPADLNHDNMVNVNDLLMVIVNWTTNWRIRPWHDGSTICGLSSLQAGCLPK